MGCADSAVLTSAFQDESRLEPAVICSQWFSDDLFVVAVHSDVNTAVNTALDSRERQLKDNLRNSEFMLRGNDSR